MIAALICGGETPKLVAICGSEVEMIWESSPSMKKAPATTVGTIRDARSLGGSKLIASNSVTVGDHWSMGRYRASRQATSADGRTAAPYFAL